MTRARYNPTTDTLTTNSVINVLPCNNLPIDVEISKGTIKIHHVSNYFFHNGVFKVGRVKNYVVEKYYVVHGVTKNSDGDCESFLKEFVLIMYSPFENLHWKITVPYKEE